MKAEYKAAAYYSILFEVFPKCHLAHPGLVKYLISIMTNQHDERKKSFLGHVRRETYPELELKCSKQTAPFMKPLFFM